MILTFLRQLTSSVGEKNFKNHSKINFESTKSMFENQYNKKHVKIVFYFWLFFLRIHSFEKKDKDKSFGE